MALGILAEALARIEHKIDLIIKFIGAWGTPMHFAGTSCPVCHKTIDYQIDIMKNVVVRKCGCTTGKQTMASPIVTGDQNGSVPSRTTRSTGFEGAIDSEYGSGRKKG